ncbi:MAG: hypothetical protein AVDCRST_MAG64-3638, partial [uncultured Phycisphaerae bacterium]
RLRQLEVLPPDRAGEPEREPDPAAARPGDRAARAVARGPLDPAGCRPVRAGGRQPPDQRPDGVPGGHRRQPVPHLAEAVRHAADGERDLRGQPGRDRPGPRAAAVRHDPQTAPGGRAGVGEV